ncbi:MAG: serine hydrolase domain-containing protein [Chloroflexota bacterium]
MTSRAVPALLVGASAFALGFVFGPGVNGAPSPSGAVTLAQVGVLPVGISSTAAPAVEAAPRATPPATTAPPPVAVGPVPARSAAPGALADRLQSRLDGLRAKYAIPGISATIVLPDGSRWTGVSGFADVSAKRRVTPDTAFAVASVSKTFTAALILELVQDGRLRLDESVAGYLPELRIDPAITVRMLLDHTSGLADFFLSPKIDKALRADPSASWTASRSLSYEGVRYFRPGRGWKYSNTNYLLLGLVAEAVVQAPIDQQIRDRFLDPLGLRHTFYQAAERPRGVLAHGYRLPAKAPGARPVDLSVGSAIVPFSSVVTAAGGAGSIASTSDELATWARALYAGNVLRPETRAAMLADVARTKRVHARVPYGLGVQVVSMDGRTAIGHSGRMSGFRSVVRWLPAEGITVAVLTNQNRADPAAVAAALVRMVAPPPPRPEPSGSARP